MLFRGYLSKFTQVLAIKYYYSSFFSCYQAWDSSVTASNIKSGFKSCGIYPTDRTAVPEAAFAPSEPTDRVLTETSANGADDPALEVTLEKGNAADDAQPIAKVLDISNPEELLQLIGEKNVLVHPLTDENGNPLVLQDQNSPSSLDLTKKPEMENAINESFLPPKLLNLTPLEAVHGPVQPARRITSHRLLTSADILKQKMETQRIKSEKENKKNSNATKKCRKNKVQ